MQGSLRMAHLVVGAIAVLAFPATGQVIGRLDPPMAGRWPGVPSMPGLYAMFGGVLVYTIVCLRLRGGRIT
ncbi:MAG TPA: hypothetical protein VD701_05965 [Steroidobacteraceae bacterium]|nr:hypothetical protein [Steroidobacteraceae bacterium]